MTKPQIGGSSKSLNSFIHNALTTFYGSLRTFVASDPMSQKNCLPFCMYMVGCLMLRCPQWEWSPPITAAPADDSYRTLLFGVVGAPRSCPSEGLTKGPMP